MPRGFRHGTTPPAERTSPTTPGVTSRPGVRDTAPAASAGWEGGRLLPGSGSDKVLYVVKDHLGSVRVVKDGSGVIRQRFDYYPYGTVSYVWTNSSATDSSEKRYRFGGKEIAGSSLTDLVGTGAAPGAPYLDFGARLYSPRTATWLSVDPLMENNSFITQYAYGLNNPINTIDANGEFPVWLLSAGLEYGFQVYSNYRYGYRGYDMWVGNVDFADVALSAIVPTGRLAIAKTFVLESAKAGVEFTTNNGFQQQNDLEHSLKQAVVATVTDAAVGSAINKSNNAVENAARQVEKTSEKAMHTANIASNRPSSTTRAKAAERAAVEAQEARTQQVGNKIVNTIIATSPETTSKVVGKITQDFYSDYDKNKEYKMAFPIFGQ